LALGVHFAGTSSRGETIFNFSTCCDFEGRGRKEGRGREGGKEGRREGGKERRREGGKVAERKKLPVHVLLTVR
jgi:hypothetical protein